MEERPDAQRDNTSAELHGRVGSALKWRTIQLGTEQGLSIARFVILARLLAPADFGLLAIGTVVLDLLLALTNLGLGPALVQLRDRRRRHYDAAWTIALVRGAVISVTLFVGADLIADLYREPRATPLLQLLAIRPLLSGLESPRLADLERELNFRALAMLIVTASVLQTVVAVALAPALGVYAIAAGMLVGTLAHTALSYRAAPHRPAFRLDRTSTSALLTFGRWVLVTSLIGIFGEAALRAVISRHLGAAELGLYYLALRLAYLPASVAGTVVGSVAFPLHVRFRDEPERAARTLSSNLRSLVAIVVPTYVVLVGLATPITRDVLGPRWIGADELISVLAIAATIGLVADAVFPMFEGRGEPDRISLALTIRTIGLLVLAWPLTLRFGVLGAALATLTAEVPVQLVVSVLAGRRIPRPFRDVPVTFAASLGAGGTGLAVGWALEAMFGPPVGALIAGSAGGIVAVATLWCIDRVLGLGLAEQLARAFPPLRRILGTMPHRA